MRDRMRGTCCHRRRRAHPSRVARAGHDPAPLPFGRRVAPRLLGLALALSLGHAPLASAAGAHSEPAAGGHAPRGTPPAAIAAPSAARPPAAAGASPAEAEGIAPAAISGDLAEATALERAVAPDLFAPDPLSGVALRGFDPVSYFVAAVPAEGGPHGDAAGSAAQDPRPGRPGTELLLAGALWRFAGMADREAFRADPAAYLPRLGGYDPGGVLRGRLVEADPLVPALAGGRLYLFRSAEARARVMGDPDGAARLLAQVEARWPALARSLSATASEVAARYADPPAPSAR